MNKSVHSPEYACFLRELRRVREEAGLSQVQVAEKIGEPQSWVSRVETGETRMHIIELRAYCQALGVETARFIADLERALTQSE